MADVLDGSPLLKPREVAARLRISPARLADPAWRNRFGLHAIVVGRRLRWAPATIDRWLAEHSEEPE
jgi:hypothetical protein